MDENTKCRFLLSGKAICFSMRDRLLRRISCDAFIFRLLGVDAHVSIRL